MNYLQMIQHTPLRKKPLQPYYERNPGFKPGLPGHSWEVPAFHQCVPGGKFEMPHVDSSLNKRQPPTKQMVRFGVFPAKMTFIQYL